jgi:ATPase subunit of ABC transporter with duplicated ATPase domains
MSILIRNLSFSYDSHPVFSGLSLDFSEGWTALIGPNGSGKSTLLNLIAGRLSPDKGKISAPDITFCPQDAERPPSCFFDPETLNNPDFFALLGRLEIADDWIERWETLSGGEKKRCLIADVLSRKPDALILDEPANHIDSRTVALLTGELARFSGIGLMVSHNVGFLDKICGMSVLLKPSSAGTCAFFFHAKPSSALKEFEKERNFQNERKMELASAIKQLSRAQKDAVRDAEQQKNAKTSKKRLNIHDSDGRAKINLAVLSGRDRTSGKKAAVLESLLHKKQADLADIQADGVRKTGAALCGTRLERPVLYAAPEGETAIADNTLRIRHPALEIRNNSRIVLTGDNGCGKTSLIERILAEINLPPESIWYLRQELSVKDRRDALEKLRGLSDYERGIALSVIYRLGSEPDSLLTTQSLSPGEARKLLFAFALTRGVSFIVLDEPTNHLDAIAVNIFADAVNEFAGTALIVTHDSFFAEKTGEIFWNITRKGNRAVLEIRYPF